MKVEDLRIRDPFILVDKENKCYYMYGTTDLEENGISARNTFWGYKSFDLKEFLKPEILVEEKDFWADRDFWAAEVYFYKGRYYLFGSCKSGTRPRGTHIFVSDSPLGRFRPISKDPITPNEWECLDGTLYVENGVPYIVFCREWLEVENGEMYAMQLSEDLTCSASKPILLFKAGDNPLVKSFEANGRKNNTVTDGPFVFKENGELVMLWSSNTKNGYAIFVARSKSIFGQWKHDEKPLFDNDGGHCMVFNSLDNKRMLSYHSPNFGSKERLKLQEFNL